MAIDRNQGITGILNPELENVRKVVQETPELGDMYSQFFGGSYQPDIEGGAGTAQYYDFSGKLNPYWAQKTIPVTQEPEPVVQDPTTMIPQTGGEGITAASAAQNMGGVNTPFEQNLIDQGAGVQIAPGQPVMDPGSGLYTQEDLNAFNQIPVNREYGDPMDIGYGEGQVDPNLAAAVGGKDTTPLGGANLVTTSSGDVFAADDPMLQEKMDYTPTAEAQSAWQQVQSGLGNIEDFIKTHGQKAANFFMGAIQPGLGFVMQALPPESVANKTTRGVVDELKAEENYGYDMQSGNLNQDPFGRNPVSAFGNYEQTLIDDLDYEGDNKFNNAKKDFAQDYFDKKAEFAGGVEVDEGTVLGPGEAPGDLVSLEQLQAAEEAEAQKIIQEQLKDYRDPILDMKPAESVDLGNPLGDPRIVPEEYETEGAPGLGYQDPIMDIAAEQEAAAAVEAAIQEQVSQALGTALHGEGGGDVSYGGPDQRANVEAASGDVYGGAAFGYDEAAEKGNEGGGSGGGKIVCTMMNESYGFGSFRNKIWLKHSKDLAPEYQIGYHKIFLPLVKLSKTNKLLKKTLEHIAVHRTIDIRQEARGKVHLLGRVYRKILEPICYLVGKYAKR